MMSNSSTKYKYFKCVDFIDKATTERIKMFRTHAKKI